MTNPIAAIERLTEKKISLPPEKKMVVRDQTDDSMVYNNIPAKVDFDNMEFNEEQVEAVTGGEDFPLNWMNINFLKGSCKDIPTTI